MAYINGKLPTSALKEIKSHKKYFNTTRKAQPKAAAAFDRLDAAFYKKFKKHIYIKDSYRSYEEQVAVKKAKGPYAATPGTSNHGWGLALDLGSNINVATSAEHKWMDANAPAFGWVNPWWAQDNIPANGQFEPWHWEYDETKDTKKGLAVIPTFSKAVRKEWQRQLGRLDADGIFGAGSATRLRARLNAKRGSGGFTMKSPLEGSGPLTARDWKAVQKLLNAWAKRGSIYLKRPLKVTGKRDARTVMALRKSLNADLWL